MDTSLINEYVSRRMKDLGFGNDYYTRLKHYVFQPGQSIEIDAHNQYFILIGETSEISIVSDFGIYDLSDPTINEQYHEHQGIITLTNYAPYITQVHFLQVIPKNQ
jgi:hypothetical protein